MAGTLRILVLVAGLAACGGAGGAGADLPLGDPGRDVGTSDTMPDVPGDTESRPDVGTDPLGDPAGPDSALPDEGTSDATDPGVSDPGPTDPGPADAGNDTPALGTKTAGQHCSDGAECVTPMTCISGQFTAAHCNLLCGSTAECQEVAPDTNVECTSLGGGSVCIWKCGAFGGGATCPGDLICDSAFCG